MEYPQRPAVMRMRERVRQPFAQARAIGQIGQRIVTRHVGDLFFSAAPLADVLVCCHPTAGGGWLV